jgi:hypothetical protein
MQAVVALMRAYGIHEDRLKEVSVYDGREVYTIKDGTSHAVVEVIDGAIVDSQKASHTLQDFHNACVAATSELMRVKNAARVHEIKTKITSMLNVMRENIHIYKWYGCAARADRLQCYIDATHTRIAAIDDMGEIESLLKTVEVEQLAVLSEIKATRQKLQLGNTTPTPSTYNAALQILNLSEPFGEKELKAAYHIFCRIAHPDRGGSVAAFQEGQNAYDMLLKNVNSSAPAKRSNVFDAKQDRPHKAYRTATSSAKRSIPKPPLAMPSAVSDSPAAPKLLHGSSVKKLVPKTPIAVPSSVDEPKLPCAKVKKVIPKPPIAMPSSVDEHSVTPKLPCAKVKKLIPKQTAGRCSSE